MSNFGRTQYWPLFYVCFFRCSVILSLYGVAQYKPFHIYLFPPHFFFFFSHGTGGEERCDILLSPRPTFIFSFLALFACCMCACYPSPRLRWFRLRPLVSQSFKIPKGCCCFFFGYRTCLSLLVRLSVSSSSPTLFSFPPHFFFSSFTLFFLPPMKFRSSTSSSSLRSMDGWKQAYGCTL